MDKSEKLYKLSAEMGSIIFDLSLSGWANELELTDKKTGKKAKIKIKVDVRNLKSKEGQIK